MNKAKKPKRPKKPDKLYTQDLLVKGKLLSIRFNKDWISGNRDMDRVNLCTRQASEFGTAIFDIYNGYAVRMTAVPKRGDARWMHLESCLAAVGKPMQIWKNRDFAEPLGIKENMISDSKLLRGERRASIDGVCHVLRGLGLMQNVREAANAAQRTANKATERKDAVRWQKKRFASYKQCSGIKGKRVHVTKIHRSLMRYEPQNKQIRAMAMPFGYWLPRYADDVMREELFESVQKKAHSLAQKPLKKYEMQDGFKGQAPITPTLMDYVWLTRQKIDTLRNAHGTWSDNANKLHMIIACCERTDGVEEIMQSYHAFGLHPQGLTDTRSGVPMYRTPDFPADQVVCASIAYFRLLITCVKPISFAERMSVFWGLLYALLDYYDEGIFSSIKLNLRDELFFNVQNNDDNDLNLYAMYFDETEFVPREEQLQQAAADGRDKR